MSQYIIYWRVSEWQWEDSIHLFTHNLLYCNNTERSVTAECALRVPAYKDSEFHSNFSQAKSLSERLKLLLQVQLLIQIVQANPAEWKV
jgi:hypothetical protein